MPCDCDECRRDRGERDDDPRADYHGSDRPWLMTGYTPPDNAIGIEMEILANSSASLDRLCAMAGDYNALAERDGSLDSELGVEIVFPPEPIGLWLRSESSPHRFARRAAGLASGYDAGVNYGGHCSRDAEQMVAKIGKLGVARLAEMVWYDATTIVQALGGRRYDGIPRSRPDHERVLSFMKGGRLSVHWENRRIEHRWPRSTISLGALKRYAETLLLLEHVASGEGPYTGDTMAMVVASNPDAWPECHARLSARGLLPSPDSVQQALDLGFKPGTPEAA